MRTKSNSGRLTGKKLKMAQLLTDPEQKMTVTEMCYVVGIARSTFYQWMDSEEFRTQLDRMIDQYTDGELANVWKALIRKATLGDVNAIKLYFEMKGRYKQELDISGGVVFISGEDEIPE